MTEKVSKQKVFLATPAYEGKVHVEFVNSLVSTLMAAHANNIEVSFSIYANSGSIPRVRNQAVATFLAGDYTDLFFIDADMGWNAEDFVRLLRYDTSVVGAAYPARTDKNARWIVVWPEEIKQHEVGLLTARRAGTGFLRVRRDAIETLVEKHADLKFNAPHGNAKENEFTYALFDYVLHKNEDGTQGHLSEDYAFCDRLTNAGFTIWIDPDVHMRHLGIKTWEGKFSDVVTVKQVNE